MKRCQFVLFLVILSFSLSTVLPGMAQDAAPADAPEEIASEGTAPAEVVSEEVMPEEVVPEDTASEVVAEEAPETVEPAEDTPVRALKIVVLLPEQVDRQWFWFHYTEEAQHIVQSAVEKALVDVGMEVIDVAGLDTAGSINDIMSKDTAVQKAAEIGAEYAVLGTAIADKKSEGVAYGVTVVRASATITARIVRVADGRILAVEEAGAEEGGQALRAAGREALTKAGRDIARKLARAAQKIAAE